MNNSVASKRQAIALTILILLLGVLALAVTQRAQIRHFISTLPLIRAWIGKKTIEEQIEFYGQTTRKRLGDTFASKGIKYPPDRLALVAVKSQARLDVYVAQPENSFQFLRSYPIFAASGKLGPKLREGDYQVPEGIYCIESLEPNTPFHLGLRVNYPNEFDLQRAKEDGRTNPGSDILIHGSNGSIGCLAMGDQASEDLFVLAYDVREKYVPLIICPVDLRTSPPPNPKETDPKWLPRLYRDMTKALASYPIPAIH